MYSVAGIVTEMDIQQLAMMGMEAPILYDGWMCVKGCVWGGGGGDALPPLNSLNNTPKRFNMTPVITHQKPFFFSSFLV